jgi:hypothetical protein
MAPVETGAPQVDELSMSIAPVLNPHRFKRLQQHFDCELYNIAGKKPSFDTTELYSFLMVTYRLSV